MIRIKEQVIGQMLAHAKKDAPMEACGYMGERKGVVTTLFPMRNKDASPDHFSLDPAEQFAVVRQLRAQGLTLRGVYHSHPASPARPSQEDLRLAFDPHLSYVIVSLIQNGGGVKSYAIRDGQAEEEPVVIIHQEEPVRLFENPVTLEKDIESLTQSIRAHEKGGLDKAELKGRRVPMGIYEQRKEGSYMVRVRCPGGCITPRQLLETARLAREHGSGLMHLTTRQEIQIHDVPMNALSPLLRALWVHGLSTWGGGGNTVRNITASPDSGIAENEVFDVLPYAIALTERFLSEPDSLLLPRKFKIAFSNSERDTAHAAFQDLGFIARILEGERGFKVTVAGGMGRKPAIGRVLHEFIPASAVYKVAGSVKTLFSRYGNRKNRNAARLRFLWNTLGEEEFRRLYQKAFEEIHETGGPVTLTVRELPAAPGGPDKLLPENPGRIKFEAWKNRFVSPQKQAGLFSVLLPVLMGKVDAKEAEALAEFLTAFGPNVLRLTPEQNFFILNIPEAFLGNVFTFLQKTFPLTQLPRIYGNSIACAGADTCKLGLCLSRNALSAIHQKLETEGIPLDGLGGFRLNISGCPNSCGSHLLSDLGFFGKARMNGPALYPAYGVVAGAVTGGETPRFAEILGEVSAFDLPDFVADYLRLHLADKKIRTEIKALFERYSRIPKFDEDDRYYRDWGAEGFFSLEGIGPGECSAGMFDPAVNPAGRPEESGRTESPEIPDTELFRDYRGVACPMNFVKIKVDLASMTPGQRIRVLVDSGAPAENVPKSVEGEGNAVLEKTNQGDHWSLIIQKK